MLVFRLLLVLMLISIIVVTALVVNNHGWNLISIFFSDIGALNWPGQFNFDFLCFLILSCLWVSWRHHFTPVGLFLGIFALFGGTLFLAPYLLITSIQSKGDMKLVFLGKNRV